MDLIDAARKGREAAFLQLFEEHHLPLYRYAYRLTGSVPDAEDVVQECFLELLRPSCSYDPGRTSLRTYLFGVVRNQSLKRRRKDLPLADENWEPRPEGSPEGQILCAELEGAIARAVTHLPETQREVLILAHYEQMPLAEIARIMALDLGAVKSRLQRARAALKETLAAHAPGAGRKP